MRALSGLLPVFLFCLSMACERPEVSTDELGQECAADRDCAAHQTCLTYAHIECPDQECQRCQIECESDWDCPEEFICNLPPLVPDTVANICEKQ